MATSAARSLLAEPSSSLLTRTARSIMSEARLVTMRYAAAFLLRGTTPEGKTCCQAALNADAHEVVASLRDRSMA